MNTSHRAYRHGWVARACSAAGLAAVLVMFVAALRWDFGLAFPISAPGTNGAYVVGVESGALFLNKSGVAQVATALDVGFQSRHKPIVWWPRYASSWVGMYLYVPFWIPAIPLAAWMAWAWRRGEYLVGCPCCGYDVGGLSSGVCPECGGSLGAASAS